MTHNLAISKGSRSNRYWRLMTTVTLVSVCVATQIFLLTQVTVFVAAKGVHDIRIAYDTYEQHMYKGNTWVVSSLPSIEHRGHGKYDPSFHPELFHTLDPDVQSTVCRIPLTQPLFIFVVLYIWTLTCTSELRSCKDIFQPLILETNRCDSMAQCFEVQEDAEDNKFVVARLTWSLKLALVFSVIIPRLCTTCYLVWIGSRWLLSTTNFCDLILNSVGLEFILHLKDVMHAALVPRRSMLDLEDTLIKPTTNREAESLAVFVGTMGWSVLAGAWVIVYMGCPWHNGFQQVLRGYNWDVAAVCSEWVKIRYAV